MTLQKTARFISLAALFLIPVFALLVIDGLFFPFITGKAFYFRILVEIAFAGWLTLALVNPDYRPKWTPLTVCVTLFALITLIADLAGVNPLRSLWSNFERMEGWITIVHLWALFIAATGIFGAGEAGRRMWHRWINVELFIAAIVAIYGIFQLFGVAAIHQGSTRIDASLGNAAYMAVYMLWNTGLAAYMFLMARAGKAGRGTFLLWAYPILAVVFGFEVFQTATRGTILGLLGGIMLACLLYAIVAKQAPKRSRWIAAGAIVVVIALYGILWSAKGTTFVQQSEVLSRMANISWSEASGQARNYIWPMAITGFAERPILGWGQENFNYVFNSNYDPQMWNNEQWFDRAHSVYLDWLAAAGALGLLAYLSLYVFMLRMIWKSDHTAAEKSVLTGLVAGYAIHNIFVFDNIASYVLFFAALAFVNSVCEKKSARTVFGTRAISGEALSYVAAPVVVVLLIVSVYSFNIRPIQANTRLITALRVCATTTTTPSTEYFKQALAVNTYVANQEIREQLLSCSNRIIQSDNTSPTLKQEFFNLTRDEIQKQIEATPFKDARTYTLGGAFYNMIAQFGYALPLLETAREISPGKQSIGVELATALINSRRFDDALRILEADFAATPSNPGVRQLYAIALVVNNQDAKARQLFADEPGLFDNLQMAQAYTMANQLDKAIAVYKRLLAATPTDLNLSVQLARLQYTAGYRNDAIKTFRDLQKAYPQYKDAIETAIQQVIQEMNR